MTKAGVTHREMAVRLSSGGQQTCGGSAVQLSSDRAGRCPARRHISAASLLPQRTENTPRDAARRMPALLLESQADLREINGTDRGGRVVHKRAGNKLGCVLR